MVRPEGVEPPTYWFVAGGEASSLDRH